MSCLYLGGTKLSTISVQKNMKGVNNENFYEYSCHNEL